MDLLEEYCAHTKEIIERVMKLMKWSKKKALLWLKTPNPNFGGVSPAHLIVCGRGHKVLKFVRYAEEENQPPPTIKEKS